MTCDSQTWDSYVYRGDAPVVLWITRHHIPSLAAESACVALLDCVLDSINPPIGWGTGITPPLANFLNNIKTRIDTDVKFTVLYPALIWRPAYHEVAAKTIQSFSSVVRF